MEWKMHLRKVVIVLWIFLTVAYATGLYVSIQNYNSWCEQELLKYPPEVRPYIDFRPYPASESGRVMMVFGSAIFVVWVLLLVIYVEEKS